MASAKVTFKEWEKAQMKNWRFRVAVWWQAPRYWLYGKTISLQRWLFPHEWQAHIDEQKVRDRNDENIESIVASAIMENCG
jgi:hypothetical protein